MFVVPFTSHIFCFFFAICMNYFTLCKGHGFNNFFKIRVFSDFCVMVII